MAKINLRKFIAEHYKAGVSARDVIREAITNSIHADAKSITVNLFFSAQSELFPGSDERNYLDAISITDNGEGFTPDNLHYFDEICTSHKDNIGGKGVGRLSFLKFANNVSIVSQFENELISFPYTPEFTLADVKKINASGSPQTTITLRDLKNHVNTHVSKLVTSICDDLRLLLFLKNNHSQSIVINFTHNSGQSFPNQFSFSGESISALATHTFEFQDEQFTCYLFRDEPPRKGIAAMLCADDLCIEEYSISKKFDVCRHLIFVTSSYFNNRSNMERQRLEIPKTETDADMISPISRDKLMPKVHTECMNLINNFAGQDIENFKQANIKKLTQYYPFINIKTLAKDIALLDADEIVKKYRATQARIEDQLVDDLANGKTVSLDDISHLACDDLARYIVHRALVIESLANTPPASTEDAIHNAILPRKSTGESLRENNIWLIDDKFLSYSNIYSDESLAKIVESVTSSFASKQQRRPDVAAFFSKNAENQPNKLVIIEFKKPGADVFENTKALTQCRLYASELTEKISSVREVFAFAVVNIDDEFYRELKQTKFIDIFSLNEKVLYQDFRIGPSDSIPLHLYVIPPLSLIKDAKARNKVFEDILKIDTLNTYNQQQILATPQATDINSNQKEEIST